MATGQHPNVSFILTFPVSFNILIGSALTYVQILNIVLYFHIKNLMVKK